MIRKNSSEPCAIRALSAPTFQVRPNKTAMLRKVLSVQASDVPSAARPQLRETSQTVLGQNRSTAKLAERQVWWWYKEFTFKADRLDRIEDDTYEKLCLYERKKLDIERNKRMQEERMKRYNLDFLNELDIKMSAEDEVELKTERHSNEEPTNTLKTASENTIKPEGIPTEGDKERKKTAVTFSIDAYDQIPEQVVAADTAANRESPFTRRMSPDKPLKSNLKRPSTQWEKKADSAYALSQRPSTHAGRIHSVVSSPQLSRKTSPTRPRTNDSASSRRESGSGTVMIDGIAVPKSLESRQKLLNEPFVYWTPKDCGQLVPSGIPYKRRDFQVTLDRDDSVRLEKLKQMEQNSSRQAMKKYSSLCDDLLKLEEWNPLTEILEREKAARETAKDDFDPADGWRKLGTLQHWFRAFGNMSIDDISKLDPNSPDVLRRCRYLRLGQTEKDIELTPQE